MTLEEIDRSDELPWGFHDAYLEHLEIDWLTRTAVLGLRVMISEAQDLDRRARVIVEGFVYCSIEPPEIAPERGYEPTPEIGLWLDSGVGTESGDHPATPDGCFLQRFFVHDWNRFVHVCGKSARLEWIEPAPVPARADTRALFPGVVIPDSREGLPDQ